MMTRLTVRLTLCHFELDLTVVSHEDSDGMEERGINTQGGILIDRNRAHLPSLDDVIVIHKIDTLRINSQYALIFSAVGSVSRHQ
jgi:hypothetical protein